jgi:transcriptional regulator with XRE-family HTH domain
MAATPLPRPLSMREALLAEQERRHINQSKAASLIGVSRAVFSRWVSETNTAYPSLYNMRAVAAFLHLDLDQLRSLFPQGYTAQTGNTGGSAKERLVRMQDQLDSLQHQFDEVLAQLLEIRSLVTGGPANHPGPNVGSNGSHDVKLNG